MPSTLSFGSGAAGPASNIENAAISIDRTFYLTYHEATDLQLFKPVSAIICLMSNSSADAIRRASLSDSQKPENALEGLLWAIGQRRSLGLSRLKPDEVDRSILEAMIEAANWGQSNGDTEPWRFAVFTGGGREVLAEIFQSSETSVNPEPMQEKLEGLRKRAFAAPVWIAIGVEPKLDEQGELDGDPIEERMAVATAVQNLHLVASAHGLVGMWHSKGVSVDPEVGRRLGWSDPAQLLGFFFCGWPNVDWPSGERGDVESRVQWFTDASA
jgi:nitroreductase